MISPARKYRKITSTTRVAVRERVIPELANMHGGDARSLVAALGQERILSTLLPDRQEAAALRICAVREGIASESTTLETAYALQGLGSYPLVLAADNETRSYWLPKIADGDAVTAFALTEPGAGSDVASIRTYAERSGSDYVLYGDKLWISNAPGADLYTVFARTTSEPGPGAITAFLIPGGTPGLTGDHIEMMGGHPTGSLHFDGVRVPKTSVLGGVGNGFLIAIGTLNRFRPSVGAAAIGMAQAALEMAIERAHDREAFGIPIEKFQAVSHPLATAATEIEAARLLVIEAAHPDGHENDRSTQLAAMSKLFATEVASRAIDTALQTHGATGLADGHPMSHLYREIRSLRIYEGTSEIQRDIIAKSMMKSRRDQNT